MLARERQKVWMKMRKENESSVNYIFSLKYCDVCADKNVRESVCV